MCRDPPTESAGFTLIELHLYSSTNRAKSSRCLSDFGKFFCFFLPGHAWRSLRGKGLVAGALFADFDELIIGAPQLQFLAAAHLQIRILGVNALEQMSFAADFHLIRQCPGDIFHRID